MSTPQIEIQIIAAITAAACALPGVFLILRRMSLMSDAISHAILVGIVIAFFATGDIASPWLVLAATATGVLTVSLVELLNRTRLVKEDAAIGLVFPALFSVGVILISRYAGDIHLDVDAVLLGELAFAPFNRFEPFGFDIGPKALYLMGGILLLNALLLILFYKELKLATFDAGLAVALGFSPGLIHYGLMSLVSVTAVGAFDTVGSVLVVALMIAPPATAYLLTDSLPRMILLSAAGGVISAISGYWLAHFLDASIAGSMASMAGLLFGVAFLMAPERGIVAAARRRARQKIEFAEKALAIHLLQHENTPEAAEECRFDHLSDHLRWTPEFAQRVVALSERSGLIEKEADHLVLTGPGRELANESVINR